MAVDVMILQVPILKDNMVITYSLNSTTQAQKSGDAIVANSIEEESGGMEFCS